MVKVVVDLLKPNPGIVLLRLKTESPFEFKPGQFVQVLIEKDRKPIRKSYSVASSLSLKGHLEICVKVVEGGYASNYLAGLKQGQQLDIEGPFGRFILQGEINNDLVFMATGAGISPFMSMIEEALAKTSYAIWLFFGVRNEQDIIYRNEFEALAAANKNFHFIPVLSRSDNPGFEHGHIQDAFKKLIKPNSQDIYICGLYNMVDEVRKLCSELGYSEEKVHYEKYI